MGCTNTKVQPVDFDPVPHVKESWYERKVKGPARKAKESIVKCFKRDLNSEARKVAWPEQPSSVKTVTQSNEDALSVKTTQSYEDALSVQSVSDATSMSTSTLTTESDTESSSSSDTESSSSSGSFELTTESDTESSSSSDTEGSSSSGSFKSAIDLPDFPPKPSRGQTTPVPKTRREEILLKNIARAGFQIDPVARDGDCFFHAAARQLRRGNPSVDTTAQQLRQDLVHHIRAHSEKFCVAVPGGFWAFQQELDKLARRGHWCSDLADVLPVALADFTAREVNLITSTEMEIMTLPPEGEESGTPLVLSYLATPGGEHYDAVKFVGG
ncbi:uncharacterized protein LOC144885791 [Branchiostoma floridae x Branchiostoma japonicum]